MTVGGLITQAKRIRTKSGEKMAFATLDDLEGQVEMLIFNSAYSSNEEQVAADRRVIVRGRVDHKERGETKLVVQSIEPFEPTPEEIAAAGAPPEQEGGRAALHAVRTAEPLRRAGGRPALRRVADRRPEVAARALPRRERGASCEMATSAGPRKLRFGPGYRVTPTRELRSELDDLLGPGALVA